MRSGHNFRLAGVVLGLAATAAGCSIPGRRRPEKPPAYALLPAEKTAKLGDREYLMRKATLGSRAERLEALDVIARTRDRKYLKFLLRRLRKEDDRFLRIKVMYALADLGDVRAVGPLRRIARWNDTRVGVEAVTALYRLGDDSELPHLIRLLRKKKEHPETAGPAYRALKKLTGANLPPRVAVWNTWYRSHRLTPNAERKWYWPFHAPLPPTVPGSTIVAVHPENVRRLPKKDVKLRRASVSFYEFWRADE